MKPDEQWLFYEVASWNVDQAAHIAKLLLDSDRNDFKAEEKVLRNAAYNFAIVSYMSPFMKFNSASKRYNQGIRQENFVPASLLCIHDKIATYRHSILAHTDITHLKALDVDSGSGIMISAAVLQPPPLKDAFDLFSQVADRLIEKGNAKNHLS